MKVHVNGDFCPSHITCIFLCAHKTVYSHSSMYIVQQTWYRKCINCTHLNKYYFFLFLDTIKVNPALFSIFHPFLMDSHVEKYSRNDVTKIDNSTESKDVNTSFEKPKLKVNCRFIFHPPLLLHCVF